MIDKKMENCNYFILQFKDIFDTINGKLFSTCDNTIEIDFRNGFKEFEVCSTEFIDNSDIFLGSKKRFIDLKKGDAIAIRNNAVIVTDIDYETIQEEIEFWDKVESEEMNGF